MSGKRLGSFRSGDRSEYLAVFGLSRLAFIDPVPRQEDFGVLDLVCILASEDKGMVYPESAFFAQVKSSDDDIVVDADAIRWITHHMDQPLLVCLIDKSVPSVKLYSTARIWQPLFLTPEAAEIRLVLKGDPPSEPLERHGERKYTLHIGPPIVDMTLSELETNPAAAHDVLRPWLQLDSQNIARRRMGRISASCFAEWTTNVPPELRYKNGYFMGPYYSSAERDLAPVLTALAHNYRHARDKTKLDALSAFLRTIKEYLDDHGLDFAEGRNVVE
jgi:hypothetical protein